MSTDTSTDTKPGGEDCAFCRIARGVEPVNIIARTFGTVTFVPLNPVTPGHLLVIPVEHVADFAALPQVSALVMSKAAEHARVMGPCNLITSRGAEATQSVFHLHLHLVPRRVGDGLSLPWGQAKISDSTYRK